MACNLSMLSCIGFKASFIVFSIIVFRLSLSLFSMTIISLLSGASSLGWIFNVSEVGLGLSQFLLLFPSMLFGFFFCLLLELLSPGEVFPVESPVSLLLFLSLLFFTGVKLLLSSLSSDRSSSLGTLRAGELSELCWYIDVTSSLSDGMGIELNALAFPVNSVATLS